MPARKAFSPGRLEASGAIVDDRVMAISNSVAANQISDIAAGCEQIVFDQDVTARHAGPYIVFEL